MGQFKSVLDLIQSEGEYYFCDYEDPSIIEKRRQQKEKKQKKEEKKQKKGKKK